MKKNIMYIEEKTNGLHGKARIGLVTLSRTGKTLYYKNQVFQKARGIPLKANYYDEDTFQDYWISQPKRDGNDSLFSQMVSIDEDIREQYWIEVRKLPSQKNKHTYRSIGKPKSTRDKIQKALRRRQMDYGWGPN